VRADSTITFVALKSGLFLGEGRELCGRLTFDDLEVEIPADVVALGPGLGRGAWSRAMFVSALAAGKPLIIDADALNLLADFGERPPPGAILTPHPGEAGRLLRTDSTTVQADRLAALEGLLALGAGVAVLKGAGTLIGAPGRTPALCERGNPGMAAPGMGDVLTGAIAGLLAQTRDALIAARAGVLIHALAGDEIARLSGERGILALEVAEALTRWANQTG
jgi:NAD(P)H-hydrate epimerase